MPIPKVIEVNHLATEFAGRQVLKDVSFSALQNQVTIVLGSSGCGKTTVLKHLVGLYPVQQGSVTVLGNDVSILGEKAQQALFLQMGVFYQNGALLNSMTVAENVALPLEQHTRLPQTIIDNLVHLKLGLVNLSSAYHLYPSQLSGGMRKRAALARAIALDPPLLFCDEPGAGLDPVSLAALDDLILKLKEQLGMSIVLVTHEPASIYRLADRIIFLDGGRVLFEGPLPDALSAGIPRIDDFFRKANAGGSEQKEVRSEK